MRSPLRPALVLGLDGATFDVIRPLANAGRLPNLAGLIERGRDVTMWSTLPPTTFPAWSSFMTGLGPGQHGLFDFTQKLPGAYRVRFTNASERAGASLFARVCAAGGRVLALGMPATWPPEPLDGLLVCGFDAPVSSGTDPASTSDPALYRRIAQRAGSWMRPDLRESADDAAFHERAVDTLLARVDRKTGFALEALATLRADGRAPDLMCVVFSESDTAAHHYWRDHDPESPRHDPRASAHRKAALGSVYERLDAACGRLRSAFGEDALCAVVSDHGFGGAAREVVHLNRRLEECGLLRRSPHGRGGDLARRARDGALRALPPAVAQALFRRVRPAAARLESAVRFGGHDWPHTAAFSEEANTQPGVWLNLAGREAHGCVSRADHERVRRDVIDALLDWTLPQGGPVVERALPREEVYQGPFVPRAPDVVVELARPGGYGLSVVATPWAEPSRRARSVRTLDDHELGGGRGRGMNGTHRPEGILIADGPRVDRLVGEGRHALPDFAPRLLSAMGVADADDATAAPTRRAYSAQEEARVAARLRALGYLE